MIRIQVPQEEEPAGLANQPLDEPQPATMQAHDGQAEIPADLPHIFWSMKELVGMAFGHLSEGDLFRCLQVSKTFSESALTVLYNDINDLPTMLEILEPTLQPQAEEDMNEDMNVSPSSLCLDCTLSQLQTVGTWQSFLAPKMGDIHIIFDASENSTLSLGSWSPFWQCPSAFGRRGCPQGIRTS